MRTTLIAYISTAAVFFGMDFVWLSLSHGPLYRARLGSLLLEKPNFTAAGGFYLLYVVGILAFSVMPALEQSSWLRAVWGGALLGAVAYGTYDMTNQATLIGWSLLVTIVDMLWGIFATTMAAVAGYFIVRSLH